MIRKIYTSSHPIVQTSCSSTQSCKHRTQWFAPHALHLCSGGVGCRLRKRRQSRQCLPTYLLSLFHGAKQQIKCNGVGFQRHYGGCRAVHPGILCTCSTSGRNHHTARSPGQARQAGWPIHNSRTFRSNHVFSGCYCCNRVSLSLFSTASDAAAALPVQPRVRAEAATSSELACTPRGRVRGQGKVRRATVSILPFYAFSS